VETAIISQYLVLMEGYSQGLVQHCLNTAGISFVVAECLDLNEQEKIQIVTGAILHDLGTIKIQRSILNKPGPLTEREWKEIKRHPLNGLQMISKEKSLDPIQEILLYHHERWDGQGYYGLPAEKIPLGARILAFANAVEAMSSPKPYHPPFTMQQLVQEILSNSGTQFDPDLVKKVLFHCQDFAPMLYNGNLRAIVTKEKERLLRLVKKYRSLNHPLVWAQSRRLDKLVVFSYRPFPLENPLNLN
jgi:HD-GYP domain-containing protein (c-di-GMP phosphodiesterase class II)